MLYSSNDIFHLFYKIATLILVVYGLVLLPYDVIEKTQSQIIGVSVFIILFVIFISSIFYHLIAPPTLMRFGMNKHKVKAILAYDKEIVEIDDKYKAIVKTDKTLIYPEKPLQEDLLDLIEVSQSEAIDEKVYSSPDCRVTKFIRKRDNTLAVLWQPLKEIIPFVPYNHKTQYRPSSDYGNDAFWQAFHVDLDTGIVEWIFRCTHRVELAVAFKLPYLNTNVTPEKLDYLTFVKKRRDCDQPVIEDDKKVVYWKLIAPKKNHTYVCFVFYEGGIKIFRNSVKKMNWMKKLFLSLKNY